MNKLLLFILLIAGLTRCQIYSSRDEEICNSVFKQAVKENLGKEKIGDIIAAVGKSFIGTEYAAHTLERSGKEKLVIDLKGMDCTTFLENTLALAECIRHNTANFKSFEKQLTEIRYRDGVINGYPSRLNYFSDWIYDNIKKGIVKNISKEIGGVPIKFDVNYMSSHPGLYEKLKENPSFIPRIREQEKEIGARTYYYIPKEDIAACQDKIRNGDLIAFTTGIKGLDITHVGIAVIMKNGTVHLLHAPDAGYKIQISEYPLAEYISRIKKDTGIIVLRVSN